MNGWRNLNRLGAPEFVFEKIVYFEDLPDSAFRFTPPTGVQLADKPGPVQGRQGARDAVRCAIPRLLLSRACGIVGTVKARLTTMFLPRGLAPLQFAHTSGTHKTP